MFFSVISHPEDAILLPSLRSYIISYSSIDASHLVNCHYLYPIVGVVLVLNNVFINVLSMLQSQKMSNGYKLLLKSFFLRYNKNQPMFYS